MQFEKDVKFLGMSDANVLSDGGVYYTVSIFEQQTCTSLALNIMDTDMNQEVLDTLRACVFGDELHAVFELRPKDKLYRLRLLRV